MRFFGGMADGKEIRVSDGAIVFQVQETDEFGNTIEVETYKIYRHERADGSLVDVMTAPGVSDEHIRRTMG